MRDTEDPLVLLLGGDAPTRTMLRFLIEDDGCTVSEVMSARSLGVDRSKAALLVATFEERDAQMVQQLESLRRSGCTLPVLALVRHQDLTLRRRLFALGARDVLTLPVPCTELRTRLRAVLGHTGRQEQGGSISMVRAGGLTLSPSGRRVDDGAGWTARLTRQETALLERLMHTPGQVVRTQELLDQLWPDSAPVTGNPLAVLVRRLRAKLVRPGAASCYVQTALRQGYVFEARAAPRTRHDVPTFEAPIVLVVEDDRATAQMCQAVLEHSGYYVEQGVGPQAPILARQLHPEVILLDLDMPEMDGVAVWTHLRASPRTASIPVIAMSAGKNLRGRAGEIRADDYLAKPFSADDLVLRIGRWTRGATTT